MILPFSRHARSNALESRQDAFRGMQPHLTVDDVKQAQIGSGRAADSLAAWLETQGHPGYSPKVSQDGRYYTLKAPRIGGSGAQR